MYWNNHIYSKYKPNRVTERYAFNFFFSWSRRHLSGVHFGVHQFDICLFQHSWSSVEMVNCEKKFKNVEIFGEHKSHLMFRKMDSSKFKSNVFGIGSIFAVSHICLNCGELRPSSSNLPETKHHKHETHRQYQIIRNTSEEILTRYEQTSESYGKQSIELYIVSVHEMVQQLNSTVQDVRAEFQLFSHVRDL